eukprot:4784903-Pyramimonas_sp.AAC.1
MNKQYLEPYVRVFSRSALSRHQAELTGRTRRWQQVSTNQFVVLLVTDTLLYSLEAWEWAPTPKQGRVPTLRG